MFAKIASGNAMSVSLAPADANNDDEPHCTSWKNATIVSCRDDKGIRPEVLGKEVSIAWGRNREDRNWQTVTGVFRHFLDEIRTFERGAKDGNCILQGALVGPQRIAKNVAANSIMMFDHDTGESVVEIANKVIEKGLFCVLWTTHSHLKDETAIPEPKVLQWMKEQKRTGDVDAGVLVDYLRSTAKVRDDILEGATEFRRELSEGGVRFVLRHRPMPRIRSLFLLEEPFDFASRGGSQAEAIQEWKERYAGVATMLGLAYDRSCVDPSRLMYTPRIPKDAERGEGKHEIIIVDGAPLNLESVERVVVDRKPRATGAVAGMGPGIGSGIAAFTALGDRRQFKTPGLLEFAAKHADDFEAAEWAKAISPEDIRYEQADKIDFRCPNEDGHTNPSADDRAFMIVNASDSVTGGDFHMGCLHDGCIAASGSDRLWYLDLLCQQFGVAHAMELEEWCPRAVEKQAEVDRATALGADPEGLEAAIAALGPDSPVAEVDAVLKALATQEEGLAREAALTTIAGKTGQRRPDLAKPLREHARTRPANDNGAGSGGGGGPRHPVPSDPEDASVIWADWNYMDQIRAVKARLAYLNAKNPTLFCRREGGLVRLKDHEGRMIGSEMDGAGWQSLLSERLEFRKVVGEQERGVSRSSRS